MSTRKRCPTPAPSSAAATSVPAGTAAGRSSGSAAIARPDEAWAAATSGSTRSSRSRRGEASLPANSSPLHAHPSRVIDALQQRTFGQRGQKFVGGLTRATPVTVVIDDEHAPACQARIEVLELVTRRRIPIRVQPQQGDLLRAERGNGGLHASFRRSGLRRDPSATSSLRR